MKAVLLSFILLPLVFSQLIEFEDLVVFPAKDGIVFGREKFGEDGPSPVDLALKNEGLFVALDGTAVDDSIATIAWTVTLNGGDPIPQNDVPVEDGKFVLNTNLLEDLFEFGDRGGNFFTVDFTALDRNQVAVASNSSRARVYIISGFEAVLPLIMLVVLALVSRNVYVAMFFGIWIGSFLIEEGNIALSFKNLFDIHIIPSITQAENFRTMTFTLFLSGFISMIKRAGGQDGFSEAVGNIAKTAKSTQMAAVLAGVGLFFDDYSSVLILGSSFKKLTDKFHVSREKLAFVADATSAPIASIAPISSWIAFELSRISPELESIKQNSQFDSRNDLPAEYPFFLTTIKSRYYPFFMLTIQVLLIACGIEFGPMLHAERKTRVEQRTDGGDGRMEIPLEQDFTNPDEDTPRKAWNFFIPIGFFITILLISLVNIGRESIDEQNALNPADEQISYILREIFGATDSFSALVYTTMGASLFALIFYLVQFKKDGKIVCPTRGEFCDAIDCRLKSADEVAVQEGFEVPEKSEPAEEKARPLMYFTEGVNIWVEGFKNLVPAILILCMAFTIKSIVTGLGTDRFFTDIILNSDISAGALPTIIFIVSAMLAVATGTSFGTMSIMFPLVSFATFEKSGGDIELFTLALSSIMAGAVFGDHSSLISDTTILASIGSGCQIGAHVYTQLPYALWAAFFAIVFGTLPSGFGADPVAFLVIGGLLIIFFTLLVAAPIVAQNGRLDFFSDSWRKITKSKKYDKLIRGTKRYADDHPDLIDPEPLEWIMTKVPGMRACGECIQAKVPILRKKSTTMDELDEIAGSKVKTAHEEADKSV